jgi:peptidoglycan/LPS O-acetylase OafA/YrhL
MALGRMERGDTVVLEGTAGEDAAPEEDPRRDLRHLPALDGLRGLAVAAVVVFHLGHLRGGYLGVDLFFVLSGFLITSLLLVEHRARRRIDLGRFWSRRARRLLPALFLVLIGVSLLVAVATPSAQRARFRGDALATLGYVANWHAMGHKSGYWDMFSQPSPLDHMWSLAIEEQFYLVWPLVVAGLLLLARRRSAGGRRLVATVAVAGALASFAVLAASWSATDTNRAYYGTDARVGPTLIGAAFAALWVASGRDRTRAPAAAVVTVGGNGHGDVDGDGSAPPRQGLAASWPALVGAVALALMVWMFATIRGTDPDYYRGGLAAFAAAAVVVVAVVTSGRAGLLGRALSVRPLRVLGIISYGVYLWHWPVIVYATPARVGVDGAALALVRVAVTLAVAGLSFVLVERPIRRGALHGRQVRLALVGAVAATAVVAVAVTVGAKASSSPVVVAGPAAEADYPLHLVPRSLPPTGTRIMLVGDSGPIFLGPALASEARREGMVAASDSQYACTVLIPEGATKWGDKVLEFPPCHDHRREAWADMVRELDPDVVVHYLAAIGSADAVRLGDEWVGDCNPRYDAYLERAIGEDVEVLSARGAVVALATTPLTPSEAVIPDGLHMVECRNATYARVAADHPGKVVVIDMETVVAEGVGGHRADMFRDPVHLSDYGASLVSAWLVPTADAIAAGRPLPPAHADLDG